jgi:hypothetical protein
MIIPDSSSIRREDLKEDSSSRLVRSSSFNKLRKLGLEEEDI